MVDVDKERDLNDVTEMLHLAKLNENDVIPFSQSICFTKKNLYHNSYRFLELDQHLSEKLQAGQTLMFKGDDDESVVLCTDERTYDVTSAETSNSLLLVDDMKFFEDVKEENERSIKTVAVSGIFYEYLSVKQGRPYVKKLRNLLKKAVYRGPEHEYEVKEEDLYSFEDLKNIIQSSEQELKEVLKQMDVVKINDKIRLLDVEYHFRALSYMLKLIDENSWALDEIDYEETLNALKDIIPEEILISLFDKYTEESQIIDGLQLYSYKAAEVCKFFAQILLFEAGKFNLDEFLQAWKESVPEGMVPDEHLLNGIALVDREPYPNVIRYFPEEKLPENVNDRFDMLFKAKEKWTVPEITPYLKPIATEKMDVNALLAKYARSSTVQGVKYYSAKHAK